MVNSFGIIYFLLSVNVNAFYGVEPSNLVAYTNVEGEYVIWYECNSEMYFIYVPWHWSINKAV
jgi:hypothetical protein